MNPLVTLASKQFAGEAMRQLDERFRETTGLGLRPTQSNVAEIVHESPQTFNDALMGRSGSFDRLHRWIYLWKVQGYTPIHIKLDADTVTVYSAL